MTIIVGLGNPGKKYEATRHNIGFNVIDRLAKELGKNNVSFTTDRAGLSLVAKIGGVILVKPQIFMNDSGQAVSSIMHYYKARPKDVWVVHDDIDLPLGKIRIREKGGSGGHKGIISIMKEIKKDTFVRFRLGVGRGGKEQRGKHERNIHRRSVIDHVLSTFSFSEAGKMKHLIKHGTQAVRLALFSGIDKAMNRYN